MTRQKSKKLLSTFYRLAKQTYTHANSTARFESRLLNLMMMLNVGNLAEMSQDELSLLIDKDYNCEAELSQCETLCPLVAKVMNNILMMK